jgi:hypothetical protein
MLLKGLAVKLRRKALSGYLELMGHLPDSPVRTLFYCGWDGIISRVGCVPLTVDGVEPILLGILVATGGLEPPTPAL